MRWEGKSMALTWYADGLTVRDGRGELVATFHSTAEPNPYGRGKKRAAMCAAAPELVEALRVAKHRAEQATRGPTGAALDPITREWLAGIVTAAGAALEKAGVSV
jgi:hypothetical protein